MFPMKEKPMEYLECVQGEVKWVNFQNNILSIQLHLSGITHEVDSDIFDFNLSNQFDTRALLASVGQLCWNNGVINFNALLGKKVMIVFRHGNGFHGSYVNPICIILLEALVPFSYQEESNNE